MEDKEMRKKMHRRMAVAFFLVLLQLLTGCGGKKKPVQQPKAYRDAVAQIILGNDWYKKGCYQRSLEHMFKAHELYCLVDNQAGVAKSFNNIGTVYRILENSESAILYFDEAIRIYKQIGDFKGLAQTLSNKSAVCIDLNLYEKAENLLDEVEKLEFEKEFKYPPALKNKGILLTRQKKYQEAEPVLKKALSCLDSTNDFEYSAVNYAAGTLMLEMKKYKEAEDYFKAALTTDRNTGFHQGTAEDLFALASLFIHSGSNRIAVDYLQRSLKLFTLLNDKKNAEKSFNLLQQAMHLIDGEKPDISVTNYFFDLWAGDKRLTTPCD